MQLSIISFVYHRIESCGAKSRGCGPVGRAGWRNYQSENHVHCAAGLAGRGAPEQTK